MKVMDLTILLILLKLASIEMYVVLCVVYVVWCTTLCSKQKIKTLATQHAL